MLILMPQRRDDDANEYESTNANEAALPLNQLEHVVSTPIQYTHASTYDGRILILAAAPSPHSSCFSLYSP